MYGNTAGRLATLGYPVPNPGYLSNELPELLTPHEPELEPVHEPMKSVPGTISPHADDLLPDKSPANSYTVASL